jgi:hypothetical protein
LPLLLAVRIASDPTPRTPYLHNQPPSGVSRLLLAVTGVENTAHALSIRSNHLIRPKPSSSTPGGKRIAQSEASFDPEGYYASGAGVVGVSMSEMSFDPELMGVGGRGAMSEASIDPENLVVRAPNPRLNPKP